MAIWDLWLNDSLLHGVADWITAWDSLMDRLDVTFVQPWVLYTNSLVKPTNSKYARVDDQFMFLQFKYRVYENTKAQPYTLFLNVEEESSTEYKLSANLSDSYRVMEKGINVDKDTEIFIYRKY